VNKIYAPLLSSYMKIDVIIIIIIIIKVSSVKKREKEVY